MYTVFCSPASVYGICKCDFFSLYFCHTIGRTPGPGAIAGIVIAAIFIILWIIACLALIIALYFSSCAVKKLKNNKVDSECSKL